MTMQQNITFFYLFKTPNFMNKFIDFFFLVLPLLEKVFVRIFSYTEVFVNF